MDDELVRCVSLRHAGNGADASAPLGEFDMRTLIANAANAIRVVKADQAGPPLQKEFFENSRHPATKR